MRPCASTNAEGSWQSHRGGKVESAQYGPADIDRVRFIKAAQRLGFSLADVASLLALDDGAHCAAARQLAERKLRDVRQKPRDLRRMEAALESAVEDCVSARGTVNCPLVEALYFADRV